MRLFCCLTGYALAPLQAFLQRCDRILVLSDFPVLAGGEVVGPDWPFLSERVGWDDDYPVFEVLHRLMNEVARLAETRGTLTLTRRRFSTIVLNQSPLLHGSGTTYGTRSHFD